MKGKIFLSGGGGLEESKDLDTKFFDSLDSGDKILYIPVALNRDHIGFEACYDWFSSVVAYHNDNKDLDFTMILENDDIPNLDNYDVIYIGGGDTFKLLDYIIRKDLVSKLKDYINNGGIVYGGSAGAIILGKDIRTVENENDNNYQYYQGLNLINDLSIICHYKDELDMDIKDAIIKLGGVIVALPENSGLILTDDGIEKVGSPFIFNKEGKKDFSYEK